MASATGPRVPAHPLLFDAEPNSRLQESTMFASDCLCRRGVGIAAGCVALLELGKSAFIERTRQLWVEFQRRTIIVDGRVPLARPRGHPSCAAVRSGSTHFLFRPGASTSLSLGDFPTCRPTHRKGFEPSLPMVRRTFRRSRVLRGPTSLAFCLGDADRDIPQGQKVE